VNAPGGLAFDQYLAGGRGEWLMRVGPDDGRPILFVPPLFEEMNRTRALLARVMRLLAAKGYRCILPDLPGTGESERDLAECDWADWLAAVREVAAPLGPDLLVASLRGGTLLDDVPARGRWRLSPVDGASLARDLARSGLAGGSGHGGYFARPELMDALARAVPVEPDRGRTVRLASDPRPAEAQIDGPALWRRSEPASSADLAEAMVADLLGWSDACGAC
jgi:hypothetical protein